jgi:hypothetical protein
MSRTKQTHSADPRHFDLSVPARPCMDQVIIVVGNNGAEVLAK